MNPTLESPKAPQTTPTEWPALLRVFAPDPPRPVTTTDPAEVADTSVFLASDLGRGVTGNVIFVDAGFQIMGLG